MSITDISDIYSKGRANCQPRRQIAPRYINRAYCRVPAPPSFEWKVLARSSGETSFEQPQFGRSRCIATFPGSTHEKAYCCGGDIFDACSDGSNGSRTRRGCCPGSDIGSSGVRTNRGGCGRTGWIYGRTIHCSFLEIKGIRPARHAIPGENPRSDPPNSKSSNRSKWTGAISKLFGRPKCTGAIS